MKTRPWTALLLIPVAAQLCGCGSSEGRAPDAVTMILIDSSESVNNDYAAELYLRGLGVSQPDDPDTVLGSIRPGNILLADVITGNSLASAALPVKVQFPVLTAGGVKLKHDQEMRDKKTEAADGLRELTLKQAAPATDLLGAFSQAGKILNGSGYMTSPHKTLIVFSDAIHQAGTVDFASERLTDRRIQELIQQEKDKGNMPDLKGVQVWFAGAGAAEGGQSGISQDQMLDIEQFWLEYFKQAGATLSPDHYGASLENYP